MGMFDFIKDDDAVPSRCVQCDGTLSGWQSKEGDCVTASIDFRTVDAFHAMCSGCGSLLEYKRPAARSIDEYELEHLADGTVRPRRKPASSIDEYALHVHDKPPWLHLPDESSVAQPEPKPAPAKPDCQAEAASPPADAHGKSRADAERAAAAELTPLYRCAVETCAENTIYPAGELRWATAGDLAGFFCPECLDLAFEFDRAIGDFELGRSLADVLNDAA